MKCWCNSSHSRVREETGVGAVWFGLQHEVALLKVTASSAFSFFRSKKSLIPPTTAYNATQEQQLPCCKDRAKSGQKLKNKNLNQVLKKTRRLLKCPIAWETSKDPDRSSFVGHISRGSKTKTKTFALQCSQTQSNGQHNRKWVHYKSEQQLVWHFWEVVHMFCRNFKATFEQWCSGNESLPSYLFGKCVSIAFDWTYFFETDHKCQKWV